MSTMKEAFSAAGINVDAVDQGPAELTTSGQEIVDRLQGKDNVAQRLDQEAPEEDSANPAENTTFQDLIASTPWWISQYYVWKVGAKGRPYLAPREDVMNDLISMVPTMLKGGSDMIFPESGAETAEAESLARRVSAITELDQDDLAFNWDAMVTKRRTQIRDEAIVRAFYAAQTQMELNAWATRLAAKNEPQDEAFGEKRDRGREQALQGALLYLVTDRLQPVQDRKGRTIVVDDASITRVVKNRMWESARYTTNDLLNPIEEQERVTAAKDADKVHVPMF